MQIKFPIIIGLGNPGKEYAKTFHNAGFLFIDYFNDRQPSAPTPKNRDSDQSVGAIGYQALKSDVYMNESGKFVAKTIKKTGAKPEKILIVHDDSDIELGKYKISFNRNSAGHNGIESIIKTLKTKNFYRLRIGIRPPEKIRKKALDFVLKKISRKDSEILNNVFEKAAEEILVIKK
ncbi:MAG: aminoacyl-tRNA hydrolase [Patescibacteria group bacterium]